MSTVALAQDLGIESTSDLKQHLAPHLGRSGALRVVLCLSAAGTTTTNSTKTVALSALNFRPGTSRTA